MLTSHLNSRRRITISMCLRIAPLSALLVGCMPLTQTRDKAQTSGDSYAINSFFFFLVPACYLSPLLSAILCLFLCFRYSIDPGSDPEALFRIASDTGLVSTVMELDREQEQWHNITVVATQGGMAALLSKVESK